VILFRSIFPEGSMLLSNDLAALLSSDAFRQNPRTSNRPHPMNPLVCRADTSWPLTTVRWCRLTRLNRHSHARGAGRAGRESFLSVVDCSGPPA
jgi:hypothetical protein